MKVNAISSIIIVEVIIVSIKNDVKLVKGVLFAEESNIDKERKTEYIDKISKILQVPKNDIILTKFVIPGDKVFYAQFKYKDASIIVMDDGRINKVTCRIDNLKSDSNQKFHIYVTNWNIKTQLTYKSIQSLFNKYSSIKSLADFGDDLRVKIESNGRTTEYMFKTLSQLEDRIENLTNTLTEKDIDSVLTSMGFSKNSYDDYDFKGKHYRITISPYILKDEIYYRLPVKIYNYSKDEVIKDYTERLSGMNINDLRELLKGLSKYMN